MLQKIGWFKISYCTFSLIENSGPPFSTAMTFISLLIAVTVGGTLAGRLPPLQAFICFFELQSIEICAHSHTCTETNSEKTRKSLEEVSLDVTTFHRIFALTICCEQYSLCFVHTASNSAQQQDKNKSHLLVKSHTYYTSYIGQICLEKIQ